MKGKPLQKDSWKLRRLLTKLTYEFIPKPDLEKDNLE